MFLSMKQASRQASRQASKPRGCAFKHEASLEAGFKAGLEAGLEAGFQGLKDIFSNLRAMVNQYATTIQAVHIAARTHTQQSKGTVGPAVDYPCTCSSLAAHWVYSLLRQQLSSEYIQAAVGHPERLRSWLIEPAGPETKRLPDG